MAKSNYKYYKAKKKNTILGIILAVVLVLVAGATVYGITHYDSLKDKETKKSEETAYVVPNVETSDVSLM